MVDALGQRGLLPVCPSHLAALQHLYKVTLQVPPQPQTAEAAGMCGG